MGSNIHARRRDVHPFTTRVDPHSGAAPCWDNRAMRLFRRRGVIVLHRTDVRCTYCRGRRTVPDAWDWLPVFLFGVVGLLVRRSRTCPRCDGTGLEPVR